MIHFDLANGNGGEMGGHPQILFEEYINITMNFYALIVSLSPKNKECFDNIIKSAIMRATKDGLIQKMKQDQAAKKEIKSALKEYNDLAIDYLKKNSDLN
jgi:hypothetical protein